MIALTCGLRSSIRSGGVVAFLAGATADSSDGGTGQGPASACEEEVCFFSNFSRRSFKASTFCLLHELDGVDVLANILVLGGFDSSVGLMHDMAVILLKKRIDAQHRVLVTLRLHHIAHNQGS